MKHGTGWIRMTVGLSFVLALALAQNASAVTAGGGTVTNYTDADGKTWIAHIFKSGGTFSVTNDGYVDVLVVAGGGPGGGYCGGGGGAGGYVYTSGVTIAGSSNYTVTVGAGGTTVWGGDSAFWSYTAKGGGKGAIGGGTGYSAAGASAIGGSGGGGGSGNGALTNWADGIAGQGNRGGYSTGPNNCYASGGGGGAGAVGQNSTTNYGGNGGNGLSNYISGAWVTYAGGGGGSALSNLVVGIPGLGGAGGGGNGAWYNQNATVRTNATAGADNTGGGGGGGGTTENNAAKLSGGSGIVIVRYRDPSNSPPEIVNLAPTNITTSSAWMNGYLYSTGGAPVTAVSVYWGTTDQGDPTNGLWAFTNTVAGGSWTNGAQFTSQATNLTENTPYYYRFAASNSYGLSWASTTRAFQPGGNVRVASTGSATWPNTGTLTIQRDASATNFAITIPYAWGGTATQGVDYLSSPAGTSVTLPAGVASTNITITTMYSSRTSRGGLEVWLTLLDYTVGTPSSNSVSLGSYEFWGIDGGYPVYDITVSGVVYRVHEFRTVGSNNLTVTRAVNADVLVVAGGGAGGGSAVGSGGNAGQSIYTNGYSVSSNLTVTVGMGGVGVSGATGGSGSNSVFGTITSTGGTCRANGAGPTYGGSGASGAGAGPGDGPTGNAGGTGIVYTITGANVYYAGGGGGGYTTGGNGGLGGGGRGRDYNYPLSGTTNGTAGADNTGGGGGGYSSGTAGPGFNGGSGIVIVRYRAPAPPKGTVIFIR